MSEGNDRTINAIERAGGTLPESPGKIHRSPVPVRRILSLLITLLAGFGVGMIFLARDSAQGKGKQADHARKVQTFDDQITANVTKMMDEGRQTFRFDTFGDEAFWGGTLKLHQAI